MAVILAIFTTLGAVAVAATTSNHVASVYSSRHTTNNNNNLNNLHNHNNNNNINNNYDNDTCTNKNKNTLQIYQNEISRGNRIMKEKIINDDNMLGFDAISKTIQLNGTDPEMTRNDILKYFIDSFDLYTSLHDNIKEEFIWKRGDSLRHPIGWYAAHTAVFYINKMRLAGIVNEPINKEYESMFAIGIDEMSWDDKLQEYNNWPHINDIYKYRKKIRQFIIQQIKNLELFLPIAWDSPWFAIFIGIEHERIHFETSSVLIRQLPINAFIEKDERLNIWNNECKIGKFTLSPNFTVTTELNPLVTMNKVNYMKYTRDINENLTIFGWDNEFGTSIFENIPSFQVSKYLVSNEEFYQFVLDGGYNNEQYWTNEGWRWVTSTNTTHPRFWVDNNDNNDNNDNSSNSWKYRTLFNIIDLPWNWPVICNHLEAYAFTQWKNEQMTDFNVRLPTEDEYDIIRRGYGYNNGNNVDYLSNLDVLTWEDAPGNINLEYFTSESPVDMFPFADTGLYDVIGNVWQHTLTPLYGFDGYQVHALFDDYSVAYIGLSHNIMRGGSWASSGSFASLNTRNWFRRHFFQFAGFRYIVESNENKRDLSYLNELVSNSVTNHVNDRMVQFYTHLHYYDNNKVNMAKEMALIAQEYTNSSMTENVLDIGCGVGRTTFELAKIFDHVTGIDYTSRLIGVGYRLAENGFVTWNDWNDNKITHTVTLRDIGLNDNLISKIYFAQNDAQNLDPKYTNYDLVIASNLLNELKNPILFLQTIESRINQYGKLIISINYHLSKHINSFDVLNAILKEWFTFEAEMNVTMISYSKDKSDGGINDVIDAHCTVWIKNS